MIKHKQPEGLLPGIYFDLDEEAYHSDPAFSHSGMRNILIHPFHYWYHSPLNPNRTFKSTEAMIFGKMCHAYLLQEKEFFKTYNVPSMGYSPGKKSIARSDFAKIEEAVQMIKNEPKAYAYFQNGYAEVSVIWKCPRTGIRLKMRVDYLRTFGIIDLKRSKEIEDNPLGWVIANHGYDMQSELYQEGLREIRSMLRAKTAKVYGCQDKIWLNKFVKSNENGFVFFFQRSIEPYVFRVIELDEDIAENARMRIDCAKDRYIENIEKYGPREWPAGKAKPEKFSVYHLPRKIFDQAGRYAMGEAND